MSEKAKGPRPDIRLGVKNKLTGERVYWASGLRNADLCKESQALKCGAAQNADTSENRGALTFAKPIEYVLLVAPSDAFYHVRRATPGDLEAAGYISLAEHVQIIDELLNRHEASNG